MIILQPAYGRKYKTVEEILTDWFDGKDFKIERGPYTSSRDYWDLTNQFGLVMLLLNNHLVQAPEPEYEADPEINQTRH